MPKRELVLPTVFVSSESDYYSNGTLQGSYGPWSTTVNVRDERIFWDKVPGENNFNNCTHTKIGIEPGSGCTIVGTDGMRRVFSGWYGAGMPAAFPNNPPTVDLKSWSASAFEAMSNPLRGSFLGPNFLGDLVASAMQVSAVARGLTKLAHLCKVPDWRLVSKYDAEYINGVKTWVKRVPCFRRIRQKQAKFRIDELKIIKAGPNMHLMWVYGVKPMDSDIKYLCDAYVSASDRIEKYLNKEGLNQKVHYKQTILKDVVTNTYLGSLAGIRYRVESTANQVYNAGMSYSYALPLMTESERRRRAWLEILGVNPASVVLEAIPFSFVAGWFTNLPAVVKANDFHWLNPKITLGYFVQSVKSTVVDRFFKGHYCPSDAALIGQGTRSVTRYSRNYQYPEKVELGFDPNFTLARAAQALSLGVQRL